MQPAMDPARGVAVLPGRDPGDGRYVAGQEMAVEAAPGGEAEEFIGVAGVLVRGGGQAQPPRGGL